MFAGGHIGIRHVQYTTVRQKPILLVPDCHLKSLAFCLLDGHGKTYFKWKLKAFEGEFLVTGDDQSLWNKNRIYGFDLILLQLTIGLLDYSLRQSA